MQRDYTRLEVAIALTAIATYTNLNRHKLLDQAIQLNTTS
jgi:hypothetical protein